MRERLQIGEVARLIGISSKTIRYYEEIGLLSAPIRTGAGYRLYSAQDLLRLQRIRRLRALGLSLERIREILGESEQDHEQTLRNALQSLIEELSAQILELEERRERLRQLLAQEKLDEAQLPGEPTPSLLVNLVQERLGAYLANISEESWQWSKKVDAMLGAFHWPAAYRESIEQMVQHIAEQPEQFQQLFTLEERFAALANAPEDSPEIEQLAEAYIQSSELGSLHDLFSPYNPLGNYPMENLVSELAASMVSPAQRRFFEAMARRMKSNTPVENQQRGDTDE